MDFSNARLRTLGREYIVQGSINLPEHTIVLDQCPNELADLLISNLSIDIDFEIETQAERVVIRDSRASVNFVASMYRLFQRLRESTARIGFRISCLTVEAKHFEAEDPKLKACAPCMYYHGGKYDGVTLWCAIHPRGPAYDDVDCPDFQKQPTQL